jgi:dienelactone hydrolase
MTVLVRIVATLGLLLAAGSGATVAQSSAPSDINPVSPEVLRAVRSFYEYSKRAVLRVDTVRKDELPTYTRQTLVFAAPLQPRVPALLAIPKAGARPFPVVVLMHGYTADKDGWFPDGSVVEPLIKAGIAVLALDAPYHGERAGESGYVLPGDLLDLRDLLMRWIVEHRRALDYLATRRELDSTRVGVLGYSLGAVGTFALAGVDSRVRVAVACVTPVGADNQAMLPIAAQTFAGSLRNTPTLMLMAKQDQYYTVDQARRLFDLVAGTRKELTLYDSGHMLPPEWTGRAAAWLIKYLGSSQ